MKTFDQNLSAIRDSRTAVREKINTSDFYRALQYELTQQHSADEFYIAHGAASIKRWKHSDPNGRIMQHKDIDVTVNFRSNSVFDIEGSPCNISEKFRQDPWNDLLIEIWSDYDQKIPGSYETSKADALYYFTPADVHIIENTSTTDDFTKLKTLAYHIRHSINWDDALVHMSPNQKTLIINLPIWIKENNPLTSFPVTMIRTISHRGPHKWTGICVTIEWSALEKYYGIISKHFNRS